MPTYSTRRAGDAFALVHKRVLEDQRLTWKAKGLMAYLIGFPPTAELRKSDLLGVSSDGRAALDSALAELLTFRYLIGTPVKDPKGREIDVAYLVTDAPGDAENQQPVREEKPDAAQGDEVADAENQQSTPPAEHTTVPEISIPPPADDRRKSAVSKISSRRPAIEHKSEVADAENQQPRARAHGTPTVLFQVDEGVKREGMQGEKPADDPKTRTHLFRNSEVKNLETFRSMMAKEVALGIDVDAYFHAVSDWSDMNERVKRSDLGWIATARKWMRTDMGKGALKMMKSAQQAAAQSAVKDWYLKL